MTTTFNRGFIFFKHIYIVIYRKEQRKMEGAAKKAGQDDTSGIIWALGACFILFLHIFDTNLCFLVVVYKIHDKRKMEGGSNENGPR